MEGAAGDGKERQEWCELIEDQSFLRKQKA